MHALTVEEVVVKYERLLLTKQHAHARLVAGREAFHQARYADLLEILHAMVGLFDGMAGAELVTFSEPQRQHVALVLRRAQRCLATAQAEADEGSV